MSDLLMEVEESLMQARWVVAPAAQDLVARIAQQYDLPEIAARLLVARNIALEDIESFLNPTLSRDFPDPFSLAGMEECASWLAKSIRAGRKVGILGDFDVDGATSTALLVRFLRNAGQEEVPFYIPDRLEEGYGPNDKALSTLKEQGCEIVVICDCGITAYDVIKAGRDMGLDIVVLDHHQAEETLPDANHVINPKRQDDTSDLDMLAACGVTYLVCVAVNAKLRESGWYEEKGLPEAPLKDFLSLVALGTVCDMVPLLGPNRLFTKFGLRQMAHTEIKGIQALKEVCKVDGPLSPYHMGFVFGPRINAGSRVHKSDLGAQLLSTEDYETAKNLAWTLNDCNDKRKQIQESMYDEALRMVEDNSLHDQPLIFVGDENWHPGLSGLVAGKLKEKYGKPSVVVTYAIGDNDQQEGRGSGRSVSGVNIGAAFIDARNEGLLLKGGGHAMAAGFTVVPDKLAAFQAYLLQHVEAQMKGQKSVTETIIDGVLSTQGATVGFVKSMKGYIGPFGQDHPEPLFVLPNVRLHNVKVVGKDHVSCQVSDWEGGSWMKAISFGSKDTPMGQAILKDWREKPFHLAGYFKINKWQGRESAEMHIQDAAPALTESKPMTQRNAGAL